MLQGWPFKKKKKKGKKSMRLKPSRQGSMARARLKGRDRIQVSLKQPLVPRKIVGRGGNSQERRAKGLRAPKAACPWGVEL